MGAYTRGGSPPAAGTTTQPTISAGDVAKRLIDEYKRETGIANPRTLGQLAAQICKLAGDGADEGHIRAGLRMWRSRSTRPGLLPRWVQHAQSIGSTISAPQPVAAVAKPAPPAYNDNGVTAAFADNNTALAVPDAPDPSIDYGPNPNPYFDRATKGVPIGSTGDPYWDNMLRRMFDRSELSPRDQAICEAMEWQARIDREKELGLR